MVLDKTSFMDMSQSCIELISASYFLKIISDQQKTILSLQEDIALLTATNHSQQELLREILMKETIDILVNKDFKSEKGLILNCV